MNRRRFLVALAIALGVAGVVPLKIAASWRPVAVQGLQMGIPGAVRSFTVSERYALCNISVPWRVDLQTGDTETLSTEEGITRQGAWSWKLVPALREIPQGTVVRGQLIVRDGDEAPIVFNVPHFSGDSLDFIESEIITFSPQFNRIEMVLGRHYYRWNMASRQLERETPLPQLGYAPRALTADGETLVYAGTATILRISTRTGQFARLKPTGVWQDANYISSHGAYAAYDSYGGIQIVDLRTGRALWKPDGLPEGWGRSLLFSPDETSVAFSANDDTKWQLRDVTDGHSRGDFPIIADEQCRAFSPDSSAFYIVADNILYRQRAR